MQQVHLAPELHRVNGAWYIYFAGAEHEFEPNGMPTHRMFVLENTDADPTTDNWVEKGRSSRRWTRSRSTRPPR